MCMSTELPDHHHEECAPAESFGEEAAEMARLEAGEVERSFAAVPIGENYSNGCDEDESGSRRHASLMYATIWHASCKGGFRAIVGRSDEADR